MIKLYASDGKRARRAILFVTFRCADVTRHHCGCGYFVRCGRVVEGTKGGCYCRNMRGVLYTKFLWQMCGPKRLYATLSHTAATIILIRLNCVWYLWMVCLCLVHRFAFDILCGYRVYVHFRAQMSIELTQKSTSWPCRLAYIADDHRAPSWRTVACMALDVPAAAGSGCTRIIWIREAAKKTCCLKLIGADGSMVAIFCSSDPHHWTVYVCVSIAPNLHDNLGWLQL